MVSCTDNFTIQIWNDHGDCLKSIDIVARKAVHINGTIHTLVRLTNNRIGCAYDSILAFWEIRENTDIPIEILASGRIPDFSDGEIVSSLVVLDSGLIVVALFDKLSIFKMKILACEHIITCVAHAKNKINALCCMDNDVFVSCADDGLIKLWNSNNLSLQQEDKTLTGHTGKVKCLTRIHNNGLASGADDGTIKIWDVDIGCIIQTINIGPGHVPKLLCETLDGKLVSVIDIHPADQEIINGNSNYIKMWEKTNSESSSNSIDKKVT